MQTKNVSSRRSLTAGRILRDVRTTLHCRLRKHRCSLCRLNPLIQRNMYRGRQLFHRHLGSAHERRDSTGVDSTKRSREDEHETNEDDDEQ